MLWYLLYNSFTAWVSAYQILSFIIQDTNATLIAALLHTITFPITLIYWILDGDKYEKIDFVEVMEDTDEKGNPN